MAWYLVSFDLPVAMGSWLWRCVVLLAVYLQGKIFFFSFRFIFFYKWLYLFLWLSINFILPFYVAEGVLKRCQVGYYLCGDGSECISHRYVCDGDKDCEDGSDEQNCDSACGSGMFLMFNLIMTQPEHNDALNTTDN